MVNDPTPTNPVAIVLSIFMVVMFFISMHMTEQQNNILLGRQEINKGWSELWSAEMSLVKSRQGDLTRAWADVRKEWVVLREAQNGKCIKDL